MSLKVLRSQMLENLGLRRLTAIRNSLFRKLFGCTIRSLEKICQSQFSPLHMTAGSVLISGNWFKIRSSYTLSRSCRHILNCTPDCGVPLCDDEIKRCLDKGYD